MMNRVSKWFCFALALCLLSGMMLFASAESAEQPAEAAPAEEAATTAEAAPVQEGAREKAQWTVMLYLCGTDLESLGGMATTNLSMVSRTVPDSQVNFVFQTGGTKEWKAKDEEGLKLDVSSEKLQRWSYGAEGFKLEKELENASMAKYSTLSDFIRWGAENFPAEKNILILWDHGGGSASGLIVDELHDNAIMSLEGLERALKAGGVHFDIFMTDTCLMANLETAQAIKPYADYLLASEEVVPGLGTNYEEFMQNLYDEPECGPVRLGRNICNATQVMYAEEGGGSALNGLTFSLIDLSRIDAVAEAFEACMKEVVSLIPDPAAFGKYLAAVANVDRYMETTMCDLYDLARRGQKGGIPKEVTLKLENAVDGAVIHNIRGSYHPYAHGLSVYMEYNGGTRALDRLARTCKNPWQMVFLDAVSLKWDAPEWATEKVGDAPELKPELYTVKYDTEVTEDRAHHIIHIKSGIDSGAFIRYELQRYDEALQVWYELGESEDVKYIAQSDDKLSFEADFDGKWVSAHNEPLSVTSKEVKGNTVLLQASVMLPELAGGEIKKLRILAEYPKNLDYDKPQDPEEEPVENQIKYTATGVWDGYISSTGLADRNTWPMTDLIGAKLVVCKPVYSDYLESTGDMRYCDEFEIDQNFTIEEMTLPKGKYRIRYSIVDMLDRTYKSDFVELEWDGTKVVYEEQPKEEAPAEGEDATEEQAA